MRTVLVCVRTPLAAQSVAAAAARLGLAAAVRTAVSDPEVMLRLAERPADVVLADTALTRPDSVGFTRRVLARAPGAALLLFGAEEPGVAAATIAAGARGLLQGGDRDLVSVVAKAMLLLGAGGRVGRGGGLVETGAAVRRALPPEANAGPGQPSRGPQPGGRVRVARSKTGGAGTDPEVGSTAQDPTAGEPDGAGSRQPTGVGQPDGPEPATGSAVVPVQRGDDIAGVEPGSPVEPQVTPGSSPASPGSSPASPGSSPGLEARFSGSGRGGPADRGGSGRPMLTERETQVLVGMAEGKSNAEIGRDLFVSEDTVKTHARRLFRKLGARDRAHAVAAGFRAGLVA